MSYLEEDINSHMKDGWGLHGDVFVERDSHDLIFYQAMIKKSDDHIGGADGGAPAKVIDPDMPTQQLRLHMGELTSDEVMVARAAIRWANSAILPKPIDGLEEAIKSMEGTFDRIGKLVDRATVITAARAYLEMVEGKG